MYEAIRDLTVVIVHGTANPAVPIARVRLGGAMRATSSLASRGM